MKKTGIIIVSMLALLTLTALPSDAARRKGSGTMLRIHVVDEHGRAVRGARVVVHRRGARGSAVVHTNRAGNAEVRPNPGFFTVAVSHGSFIGGAGTTTLRRGEKGTIEIRVLGRHAMVVHAHEEHHLGLIHHDHDDHSAHDDHHDHDDHKSSSKDHTTHDSKPAAGPTNGSVELPLRQ